MIENLNSVRFGKVAAEDEAKELAQYFLETQEYSDLLQNTNKILVVGRKGSGKSAIYVHLRDSLSKKRNTSVIAIELDAHAWSEHKRLRDDTGSSQRGYVASWNYLILVELIKWLLDYESPSKYRIIDWNFWSLRFNGNLRRLNRFMQSTYGQIAPTFFELLVDKAKNLVEIGFLGLNLKSDPHQDAHRRFTRNLIAAASHLQNIVLTALPRNHETYIIFDQLDRAWDGTDDTKDVLVGLVLAAKDLIRDADMMGKFVRVVIFLRDDIYEQLRFQDKNKITQSDLIDLKWNAANLRNLIERRVESSSNLQLSDVLTDQIIGSKQDALTYMLARTLLRPRDIISFCTSSLEKAKNNQHNRIEKDDIKDGEAVYSQSIYNEYVDENHVNYPHFEKYIDIIRELKTTQFSFEKFVEKYEEFQNHLSSIKLELTPTEILKLLVDLSILGVKPSVKWVYKYIEPNNSSFARREFNNSDEFQVHESLKKSLGLIRPKRKSIDGDNDDDD